MKSAQRLSGTRAVLMASALGFSVLGCGDDGAPPPVEIGDEEDGGMDAGPDATRPPMPDSGRPDSGPDDAGGHDTGRPPPPDAGPPDPPDEDGGTCDEDCAALTTECATGVCNPATLECELVAQPDGSECGDLSTTACSAKDSCEGGVCQAHHASAGAPCGDQGDECHFDDECNAEGECVDNGLRPFGTECGSQTETECDAPDSCDATGECVPNFAQVDAPCGDQGVPCRDDDTCNGSGVCVDQGRWEVGACPNGVPVNPEDGRCICGDPGAPAATDCRAGPAVCDDGGACVPGNVFYGGAEDGAPCNRDDGQNGANDTECDNPDTCLDGECVPNNEPLDEPCGDRTTNTACDGIDACDGFGQCDDHLADVNTTCGDAPGPCFNEPLCNGSGACLAASGAPPGTMCGSQSSSECDGPDVCDGFGGCDEAYADAEIECGPEVTSVCDAVDQCNGSGNCVPRFAESDTVCGVETECSFEQTCDGAGTCAPDPKPAGEPCSGDFTQCQNGAECDGDGACAPNYAPPGTECGEPAVTCEIQDTCNAVGECQDGGGEENCDVLTTISVEVEFVDAPDEPVAGVLVELVGSDPLQSGTTDENGEVQLTLPASEAVLLRIHPTASAWGYLERVQVDPANPSMGFELAHDDVVVELVGAPGLAALDTSRGILSVRFRDVPFTGGESVSLAPSCSEATCGPVSLDESYMPVLSDTLLPLSDQMFYANLIAGDYALSASGVPGTDECTVIGSSDAIVFAHTTTMMEVGCTPE